MALNVIVYLRTPRLMMVTDTKIGPSRKMEAKAKARRFDKGPFDCGVARRVGMSARLVQRLAGFLLR